MGITYEQKEITERFLSFSKKPRKKQTESETEEKPKVKWFIYVSQNFPIK